jgi:hypothetical protein
MRNQFLLLSALSSLLMSGYPVIQSVRAEQLFLVQQQQWKQFSSSEGGFTVLMPVTPTQNRQTTDGNNVSLDANLFTAVLEEGKVKYSVSYTNFPDDIAQLPPEFILDSLSSRFTNDPKIKLLNQQNIRLEQYSGKEFKFEAPDNKIVKYRVYLVKKRLYQLTTEIPKDRESSLSADIEKFMTSFQLVK